LDKPGGAIIGATAYHFTALRSLWAATATLAVWTVMALAQGRRARIQA
jgi:hypothetical protein